MKLSALDLSPILSGETATDALGHSVALARHAESLGMTRFWVAEHHNAAAVACSCPELLIARVASVTEHMRVGAGGIMLPNHTSLKVAETFRVLTAMFPDRIDLGLGRAPGTDPRTAAALRRGETLSADAFPEQLEALLAYLSPDAVPRAPFTSTTIAIPANVPPPSLFILSSSGFGAELAAKRGLALAFAHHMNPRDAQSCVRSYREAFVPSRYLAEPYAVLSVSALCAPSESECKELAAQGDLAMLRMAQGKRDQPLPSAREAAEYPWDKDEKALRRLHRQHRAPIVGSADQVADELAKLATATGADELMLLTMVHDQDARRRSYTMLAERFGLVSPTTR